MVNNQLAELRRKREDFAKRQELADLPSAEWFSIKQGEKLRIQFLQDMSTESEHYNPAWGKSPAVLPGMDPDDEDDRYDIGLFLMAKEHTAHGAKGKGRALDTMKSEGRDFAQEMYERNPHEKGWKAKDNFYVTVAVDRGQAKPSVEILTRGVFSEFVEDLMEYFEEHGTIMGSVFVVKKGREQTSPWRIQPGNGELDVEGLKPFDLARQAVKHIPYEQQKTWYEKHYVPEAPKVEKSVSKNDDPWASEDDDDTQPDW